MEDLIKEALKLCGFSTSKEARINLIEWARGHMVESDHGLEHLDLSDWLTTIGIASPDTILPAEMYFRKHLDKDVIVNMCERLKKKKLNATKREIHELCFGAEYINEHLDKIKDLSHAINYVLAIFNRGGWETPEGFEETFPDYVTKSTTPLPEYKSTIKQSDVIH
jgi:hypothetical protein